MGLNFRPHLSFILCTALIWLCLANSPHASADSPASLAKKGEDYYHADKMDESIAAYKQALALDPNSAILRYDLGTALARKGKSDEAAQALHQAAQESASPARPDALFNLGTTLAQKVELQKESTPPTPVLPVPINPKASMGSGSNTMDPNQPYSGGGTFGGGPVGQIPTGPTSPSGGASDQGNELKNQIETLEKALQAFRQAILNDPRPEQNQEAKYNYEVTSAMLKQLKERKEEQEKQQKKQQQQKNNEKCDNPTQGDNGKSDKQPKPNPSATPSPTPGAQDQNNSQASPTPGASATPQPNEQGNQNQEQKGDQDKPNQDNNSENQPSPTPTPSSDENQQPQPSDSGKNDDKKNQSAGGGGTANQPPQQTPTPEQMEAQRILSHLEKEKPEQFKKLYQFKAKSNRMHEKDW